MKKSLTSAQMALIMAELLAVGDIPVEDIELSAVELEYDVNIDMNFDVSMDLPPMSAKSATPLITPAAVPCHGTRKISIRVPKAVLNAFREQAKRKGTREQTLMNRVLKEASKGW